MAVVAANNKRPPSSGLCCPRRHGKPVCCCCCNAAFTQLPPRCLQAGRGMPPSTITHVWLLKFPAQQGGVVCGRNVFSTLAFTMGRTKKKNYLVGKSRCCVAEKLHKIVAPNVGALFLTLAEQFIFFSFFHLPIIMYQSLPWCLFFSFLLWIWLSSGIAPKMIFDASCLALIVVNPLVYEGF